MKIIGILEIVSSKPDTCGNSYSFAVFTPTETGKSVRFACGNAGCNAKFFPLGWLGGNWDGANGERIYIVEKEIPIRQFNRIAKDIPAEDYATEYEQMVSVAKRLLAKG